jgi:hypothetical protein
MHHQRLASQKSTEKGKKGKIGIPLQNINAGGGMIRQTLNG